MIQLNKVRYAEYENKPQEWKLEGLSLSDTNLIVGKNATGKTRTLNVISGIAKQLAGVMKPRLSGTFDVEFSCDGKNIRYELKVEGMQVLEERFSTGGTTLLNRKSGGKGTIWAEEIGKEIRFQTPPSELAAVARRDSIQHNFLEPLYTWGSSLRHYHFGSPLGKDHFVIFRENDSEQVDDSDDQAVVPLYKQAVEKFKEGFSDELVRDMQKLGYEVEEVGISPLISISFKSLPGEAVGLYVREKGLRSITDHHSMSQGMFRALSLLIQVNYSRRAGKSTCILIDDIGEGLDFDRSCRLIDVLREKTKASNIQLVLSTNDRFVMNRVPLEEWSVLRRQGSHVQVLNYENSRNLFEEFKFTGLSNFSFLEMDFASGPPTEEDEEDE